MFRPAETRPSHRSLRLANPAALAVLHAAVLLALLSVGCASPQSTPPAPSAPPSAAEPEPAAEAAADDGVDPSPDATTPATEPDSTLGAPSEVRCFYGPTVQRQPDGAESPGADVLVRRSLHPDDAVIVEETVRYDDGGARPRPYTVRLDVDPDAGTFTLRESDGRYTGRGTLQGEPWAWDAWTYSYRLTSGIAVQGETEIRDAADGAVYHSEKEALGPDGGLALTLVEDLPEISLEDCGERLAAAGGGS